MTVTIQQEEIGKCYISIEQEKYSSAYKVSHAVTYNGAEYHERSNLSYNTLQKAKARYNYLKHKIQKGDI